MSPSIICGMKVNIMFFSFNSTLVTPGDVWSTMYDIIQHLYM